ncbi:MAG: hypothetical protein ABSC94_10770 [Polyangiaceae bacterium]
MRARALGLWVVFLPGAITVAQAQPARPLPAPSPPFLSSPASPSTPVAATPSTPVAATPSTPVAASADGGGPRGAAPGAALAAASDLDALFARALRAYHAALLARRLGVGDMRREDVSARVAEGEELLSVGRVDEAIARLADLVEHPQFELFADSEEGRAAIFRLADALARAGIAGPARSYLRRLVDGAGAWSGYGSATMWARRAARRLVDIGLETEEYGAIAEDLRSVPTQAPEEVRGELAYMNGRSQEAAGNPTAALGSYAAVTQRCRFWAQATYLSALIEIETGNQKQGEDLLCKVADPKRIAMTTPVFADEKFFAVRDLARLGLGRIAHEQGRNDDARYYYYLVPRDSDRLAEALYEAATTRYEKKDYEGAHDLLEELTGLGIKSRYEDEAWVLGAWVDLARCRFADADKKLTSFLARYEPVRDAARHIAESGAMTQRLLATARGGADAAGAEVGGVRGDDLRTIAALVRVDPAYDRIVARRAVLERQASGLVNALGALGDMQTALATNGGVRPASEAKPDEAWRARDVASAIAGLEHEIADLDSAHASMIELEPMRRDLAALRDRASKASGEAAPFGDPGRLAIGADLPDLLRADTSAVSELQHRVASMRQRLGDEEQAIAKDALHRLDLRLSRLLRRARLGRIESVLGRKRALEVEIEAIRLGYLPQDAVDSLNAAEYLEDNEEYWPFEGDDWPDEYVGGEVK